MSPYVPIYDLAILVPAGAFFVTGARATGGLRPGERLAIVTLAALSFDPRGTTLVTHVPTGVLVAGGAFLLVASGAWRRAAPACASSLDEGPTRPAPARRYRLPAVPARG